jgi:hypothetical protein
MDPREAHVTGASQVCAPCPARHSAFNPSTAGILRLKRVCRFPLLGRLDGLILRLEPDGERPPSAGLAGRAGCVLLAPINLEMLGVKAGLFAGCQ